METVSELMAKVMEILPNATLEHDSEGQMVIFSHLYLNEDETLREEYHHENRRV